MLELFGLIVRLGVVSLGILICYFFLALLFGAN